MDHLNDYIIEAIITLRQKQPNEDSILNILTSKIKLLKKKLDSQLNELIKQ